MKRIIFFLFIFLLFYSNVYASELETVIIEVEGNVDEHEEYIEKNHPFVEVVATYSTLFNGLAIQGKAEHLKRMHTVDFIKGVHHVQDYQTLPAGTSEETKIQSAPITSDVTGKNIKVAVIDTGVDYNHPDLKENFKGGQDLVDFDEDPMETLPEEGMPTNHGTHVAGIIAANGEMQGIAPDASLYAYRALGPGGFGSTVHVLAALEQAVQDKVDIINLSLGNSVNGPDYPTSVAVNKAVELGIPVVIANGNSGPDPWTVGSPATAADALSVGAVQAPTSVPYLYHEGERKAIQIATMQGATSWDLTKDYKIVQGDKAEELNGKIALFQRDVTTFRDYALEAQRKGAVAVLIYNNEPGPLYGGIENNDEAIKIPVAGISEEDGEWLLNKSEEYIATNHQQLDTTIADFSSRGPVTVNWEIKPDITAPGTAIKSTVPGGYESFNGTSMAAPYVTGAIALLKEAYPSWDVEKIYSALQTTAEPLRTEAGEFHTPSTQGHGLIQPEQALNTRTVIYDGTLEAGKITERHEEKQFNVTIENLSDETQEFTFEYPKQQSGIQWQLPLSFTVEPKEKHELKVQLKVSSSRLPDGVHEGFLTLKEKKENKTYHLPYLFVNQSADQPKIAGIEFYLKPFSEDTYSYNLYATEELRSVAIDLYDPDILTYRGNLIEIEEPTIGTNEGEIPRYKLTPGNYIGRLIVISADGEVQIGEMPITIE
ncbi:S8 family serine peptidase [Oceanobacillus luteolus]|uniref:S8 family serine peptidase n=1 Tax=Oceanobacillus luteolus TaxID=1274358 RepID=UPI00255A081E|nr:S8 family serine peptidase [Oceanobacillus luteolus]